jgi:excisionase family DNA binding protein
MDESETYTLPQAMKQLRVTKQTIYKMITRGQLTKYEKPYGGGRGVRRVRFSKAEVDALATSIIPAPVPVPKKAKPKRRK